MCGSSGNTTPPPSPPPTTFNYTAADRSNTQRRAATAVGQTSTLGSDLGSGGPTTSANPTSTVTGG